MTDDEIRKLKAIIKEEVKPVKELAEITNQKVRSIDGSQMLMSSQLRRVGDQISVMNEKLDKHTDILDRHTNILNKHTETLGSHTASLVIIEDTLKGYGDMYKVNKAKTEDLDARVGIIEDHLGLAPQK